MSLIRGYQMRQFRLRPPQVSLKDTSDFFDIDPSRTWTWKHNRFPMQRGSSPQLNPCDDSRLPHPPRGGESACRAWGPRRSAPAWSSRGVAKRSVTPISFSEFTRYGVVVAGVTLVIATHTCCCGTNSLQLAPLTGPDGNLSADCG